MENLKELIREVPDYPKKGINFFDITTLLKHPSGLRTALDGMTALFRHRAVDQVVGMESRGFIFAPHLAHQLSAGFVPVRKPGKLPAATRSQSYDLEYGTDSLEMHHDAITEGSRVLVVDDVIATGGTAEATARLVESCGGQVVAFGFLLELTFLPGRDRLEGYEIESLLKY